MGQLVGRMPKTWENLMEERDRVLHWSSEVLARIDDNINNEESFLMDYDDNKIMEKVNKWISDNRIRKDNCMRLFLEANDIYRDKIHRGLTKIASDVIDKMQKEYSDAYNDIRKFTQHVDSLGERQRKIHIEIQKLSNSCTGNAKKFARKFAPLRLQVFHNVCISEKIAVIEKRLFNDFHKQIYVIDHKYKAKTHKLVEKFIRRV